jgi:chromosomal replication initiator protein
MTVAHIQAVVADYYNLSLVAFVSDTRRRSIARPRQVAMWLTKEHTCKSLPEIGRRFHRDHTTIIHGIRNIDQLMQVDGELAEDILAIEGLL